MSRDRKQKIIDTGIFKTVLHELFPKVEETKADQFLVNCCFHDDKNPSLSVNVASGLYNCFSCGAAGNFFDLYMKAKSVDFKICLVALENAAGIEYGGGKPNFLMPFPQVVATFYYHDEKGNRRYHKKRYEPGFSGKRKKSFAFYHMVGGREKKGRGGEPLLYNLHLLVKASEDEPIFVLEGEKKADLLTSWNLVATSLDSGGQSGKGSSWKSGFTKYFKNRDVYILPDNDKTGETYANSIADNLLDIAKSVKILRLPSLPAKGDILDWAKKQEAEIDQHAN